MTYQFRVRQEPFELESDFATELIDTEWESEFDGSRDYIKWVQQSLNRIMGLRLPVDGILSAQTRSAIRSFQHHNGLMTDGKVGTQTEAAIVAAETNLPDRAAWYSTGSLEFEEPRPASRPTPSTVDAEAAEPIFSGRVRLPETPLLDAASLQRSIQWNQAMHPKVSGIPLSELCARLEKYIDRPALEKLMRQANIGTSIPALATLLAHQFQLKTCRTPTVGEVCTPRQGPPKSECGVGERCTVDGRVAEDTLDSLGFVYHTGKALNTADQRNSVAATTLGHLPASAFAGVEPGLTASTWWSYMVNPPWLGLPIKHGIHLVLLKRLRRAQRALMSLPAYAGLSPAELGRTLGLEEQHKGARPGNTNWSMHLFGLAIDISFTRNPWVSNPQRNTARLPEITLRAARLVGRSGAREEGITARFLHGLAATHRDTAKIYKILAERTRWLAEYFALAGNAKQLEGLLPIANVIHPEGRWFKAGESLTTAARRWSGVVRADFDAFATAVARGGTIKNEVRHGFMDLPRDLVIAFRDEACLGWGAVDFGSRVSGDMMHFDSRIEGIGRTIAKTSGKPFVPDSGHPCLPVGGSPLPELEFEQPTRGNRSSAPPPPSCPSATVETGHWLKPFASTAIPSYSVKDGKPQWTDCSINVPNALWQKKKIDLLVFFHGLFGPCKDCFDPDPKATLKKFQFDAQIESARRKVVLAVPRIFWKSDGGANVKGIWTAANFNRFVNEVLFQINSQSGVRPTLGRLIIAGHSRAYAVLTPLALEFNQGAAATTDKMGALAKLDEVWAMDSTYGPKDARALEAWASRLPKVRFIALFNKSGAEISNWKSYYQDHSFGFGPPPNLRMCTVDEKHCIIPTKYIGQLLSATTYPPIWCKS